MAVRRMVQVVEGDRTIEEVWVLYFVLLLYLHIHQHFNRMLDLVDQCEAVHILVLPLLLIEELLVVCVDLLI